MLEQSCAVHGIHTAVAVCICALLSISVGQKLGFVHVLEQTCTVHSIHAAVPVHISQQPNLRVLGLRAGGHCHRILTGDMIFLRHLHGVVAGRNAGNGVGSGISLDKNDIRVTIGKKELSTDDFELVDYSNNVKKGTAQVIVRGVGEYAGTKVFKFTISAQNMQWYYVN